MNFVEFYIDGVLSQTATSAPYTYNASGNSLFDTTKLTPGSHTLGLHGLSSDNRTYSYKAGRDAEHVDALAHAALFGAADLRIPERFHVFRCGGTEANEHRPGRYFGAGGSAITGIAAQRMPASRVVLNRVEGALISVSLLAIGSENNACGHQEDGSGAILA
jgi:hypothetical protein